MQKNIPIVVLMIGGLILIQSIAYPYHLHPGNVKHYAYEALIPVASPLPSIFLHPIYILLGIGILALVSPFFLNLGFVERTGRLGTFSIYFTSSIILSALTVYSFNTHGSVEGTTFGSGFYLLIVAAVLIFIGAILLLFRK